MPDDSRRADHASAPEPAFHQPVYRMRRADRAIAPTTGPSGSLTRIYPTVEGRASDLGTRFALQHHRLPVQRQVIAILRNDWYGPPLHHWLILFRRCARQRCRRQRRATPAGPRLTLGHAHEIARRLDIELLALVVADHRRLLTAPCAGALVAANDAGDARQILW